MTPEQERDQAQALIGDIRAIISRPGKRLDAINNKLTRYRGDYELQERRARTRHLPTPAQDIVAGIRRGTA